MRSSLSASGKTLSLRHEGYLADSVIHGDTAMRLSRTKGLRSNGDPRRTEGNMMREIRLVRSTGQVQAVGSESHGGPSGTQMVCNGKKLFKAYAPAHGGVKGETHRTHGGEP